MKPIKTEELKSLQIDILNNVSVFCKNQNIKFWLDCGTLLGAIRHKGFIPWDDDIDIGMLRPDYEKFMYSFNKYNDRYQFKSIEIDENYCFAFGKVLDTKTVLYEPDRNGIKLSVYVDVFVYDNAPSDEKKIRQMYDKRDFLRKLKSIILFDNKYQKVRGGPIRQFIAKCLKTVLKLFPPNYFDKMIIKNSKRYSNDNTLEYVGNFTSQTRILCPKKMLSSFIMGEFEGDFYPIPKEYHDYLVAFYGPSYMSLPPVEKRRKHIHEAFYLE